MRDANVQTLWRFFQILDVQRNELRAPQRSCKAKHEQRAIAEPAEIIWHLRNDGPNGLSRRGCFAKDGSSIRATYAGKNCAFYTTDFELWVVVTEMSALFLVVDMQQ